VSDCEELVGVNHFLNSEHIQKKSYQNFLRHRWNTYISINTQAHQKQQGHDKWGFVSCKNPKQ